MGVESRQKTAKKGESARTMKKVDKGPINEFEHLREAFNRLWTSWTATNNSSDLWRRIEQSGLENALKRLSASKTELAVITGISSEDSIGINSVMVELGLVLDCIRQGYVDNEKDIFDGDEKEKRFLTSSCPTIIEIWSEYSTFAADFAISFVEKGWLNSSEHTTLLNTVMEVAASSVKLLVLSVNMAAYHSLEDAGGVNKMAVTEAGKASTELEEYFKKVDALGENHTASGLLTEILGWQMYGLSHLMNKVIKIGIEARGPEDPLDDHEQLVANVNNLLEQFRGKWGEETSKPGTPPPPAPSQQEKKGRNRNKKGSRGQESKDSKKEEPPPQEEESKQKQVLEALQKLTEAYKRYSDNAWQEKRLPVMKGSSGVVMRYRTECYETLGKLKLDACPMANRKSLLDSLNLTEFHRLHSDIFTIAPEGLTCDQEVTLQFPLMPWTLEEGQTATLKVKVDGQWTDVDNMETVDNNGQPFVTFNTNRCEAFTALSYGVPDTLSVGPAGANYVSASNGKVEIAVPNDCFSSEVTLAIKTHEFSKRNYDEMFIGVVSASVAVEVTSHDGSDVEMHKSISIQMPIADDQDDRDTELVVVRSNGSTVQVLGKKQLVVRTLDSGLYAIDVKGLWCVAVLRIKRIFLNMRESIKKEYFVGFGKKFPCNIVTYIDDVTRGDETQTFVMEMIEKCLVNESVETRRQAGMFEVKKGRSRDILVQRGDNVMMALDGQLRPTELVKDNTLCFLRGGSNRVSMATEIKRDPEKLPDAMICYKQLPSESVLHTLAIMTRDLSELPTESITARTGMNLELDAKRDKLREESAEQLLKMESLMALARELTVDEGASLGHMLGLKGDKLKHIREANEKDVVSANFETLCEWRGSCARSAMADFLVSSLKSIGKVAYADLVTDVRRHNRALDRADFERCRALRRSKTTL